MKDAEILLEGKTLIYPTDTVWGIGCDARNIQAIEKIKRIKGRGEDKSFILLMRDRAMLECYFDNIPHGASELAERMKKENIPATILYPNCKNLPLSHLSFNEYVGVRLVDTEYMQNLFNFFPYPIVSSSANFSGQKSPGNFAEIDKDFLKLADYVSMAQRDDNQVRKPSSVFIVSTNGEIKQLR
ncbi:MAG: Sua5/YciO/YrdC/YwlC family protein [Bacteroidales bacterium]|nr:Sua5/YciO/YrdC/YwlC family protein [Bacteroidales bacterium]